MPLETIEEETPEDLEESEKTEPVIAPAETTSTKTETAPAETPLINPEIFERARRIAEKSPDLIKFASGVKAAFEDMTKVLSPGDLPEGEVAKTNKEKIASISEIGEGIDDSGLKTFANAATKILCIDQEDLPDNSAILNSLITAFGFLGEEGPKKEDPKEDIALSILEAVHKATSSCRENEAAVDAINSGFKEAFPGLVEEEKAKSLGEGVEITPAPNLAPTPSIKGIGGELPTASSSLTPEEERKLTLEEQRIRDETKANRDSVMEIMPDVLKGASALTLALAVPPPLGVILALGFLAYTWDMGHKPEEKKPEIFNDPDVQKNAEAWKKFINPSEREITAQDIGNFNKAPTVTGGAASRVIIEAGKDLNEDKKVLENTEEVLKAGRKKSERASIAERSPTALGGEELFTEETGGEELVMDGLKGIQNSSKPNHGSLVASSTRAPSENFFTRFVNEEGGELLEEESKESARGGLASKDYFDRTYEGMLFPKTAKEEEAEAEAAAKEVGRNLAASLAERLTSKKVTTIPATKEVLTVKGGR